MIHRHRYYVAHTRTKKERKKEKEIVMLTVSTTKTSRLALIDGGMQLRYHCTKYVSFLYLWNMFSWKLG